jgi:VRR-NUC domain-containing protein
MSPEDRARYSPEETIGSEALEQGKFAKYLKEQWQAGRLEYFWQRLDKRATGKPGTPDFIVALPGGKTHWIEFKSAEGTLSPVQSATLKNLVILGHSTFIAHSGAQAIALVARALDTM